MPENTILVVGSHAPSLELIQACLASEGYCVVTEGSGEDALERVGDLAPDLMLLDILMPDTDGFTVCRSEPYRVFRRLSYVSPATVAGVCWLRS